MVLSHFKEFVAYWQELRGAKLVPNRADFRPARMRHLLPRMIIIERCESGEFIVRLAGTEIVERLGEEITHKDYFGGEVFSGETILLKDLFSALLAWPMGLAGTREWITPDGAYDCHFLYLPFSHKGDEATELMTLLHFDLPFNNALTRPIERIGAVRERALLDLGQGIDPAFEQMPRLQLATA